MSCLFLVLGVTRKIVRAEYEFESPYWDDISEPAKELVTQVRIYVLYMLMFF